MKKFTLLATVVLALSACTAEDNIIDDPVELKVTATIGDNQSRASNGEWAEGDAIGVTMSGRYSNMKFVATEEGDDGKFACATTLYFKNKVVPVTLTAYYPYSGTEGQAPEIFETSTTLERQTAAEQPSFDFLYASEENVTGENPEVTFEFHHMMSKLTLIFEKGAGMDNSTTLSACVVNGLVMEGTFNPVTGVCSAKETEPTTLNLTPDEDGNWPSLILFPQEVEKIELKITDSDNQEYRCDLLKDQKLASGNNYVFKITVNKTGLNINPSIKNWEEVENEAGAGSYDD